MRTIVFASILAVSGLALPQSASALFTPAGGFSFNKKCEPGFHSVTKTIPCPTPTGPNRHPCDPGLSIKCEKDVVTAPGTTTYTCPSSVAVHGTFTETTPSPWKGFAASSLTSLAFKNSVAFQNPAGNFVAECFYSDAGGLTLGNLTQATPAGSACTALGKTITCVAPQHGNGGAACGERSCGQKQTCCTGMPFRVPTCVDGTMCPRSQRAYKTDIRSLTPADVTRMQEDLLRMRLAQYRYKADGVDGPKHLGFIIDDVGRSPAIGADGEHVNLYGYASMAVAAAQAQAKQIAALQEEMRLLREALKRLQR